MAPETREKDQPMTITEKELEEWEAKNRNLGDHVPVLAGFIAKLIAEVRRQCKEIERLEAQNEERRMIMDDMDEALAKRAGRRV